MRLLVVYQHAPTPGAPGIYRHRTLLAGLVRRGWHVDLVSSPINYMDGSLPDRYAGRAHVHEVIDGIHHHWVRASGDLHRSFRRRALNYATFAASATLCGVQLPRPDIVLASSPPLSVASAGRWIARRHRVPWALEVRDLWPESAAAVGLLREGSAAWRLVDRQARASARAADIAIVPTPGLVELVRGHGARRVELVTGVIQPQPPDAEVRRQVRADLGVAPDACLFAYVGAHGVVNGLDVLLDAAELVSASPPAGVAPPCVVLAGAGSAYAALSERLARRPIPNLQMLGAVPKEQAGRLLDAADVGLHVLRPDPLFESALPTKVLEYLGRHLPFITTVPGLPQQVAAETGGDFAPDAPALAEAMVRWAAVPPHERLEAGRRAAAWGEQRYGLEPSLDRLEAALQAALRSHAAARRTEHIK